MCVCVSVLIVLESCRALCVASVYVVALGFFFLRFVYCEGLFTCVPRSDVKLWSVNYTFVYDEGLCVFVPEFGLVTFHDACVSSNVMSPFVSLLGDCSLPRFTAEVFRALSRHLLSLE